MTASRPTPRRRQRAFTLLEVMIALGILAVALMVLVGAQGSAVVSTMDADKTGTAAMLAEEKLKEVMITLEKEGWTDQDKEEDGDFEDFGEEDFRGDASLQVEYGDSLNDFHWAWTVRKVELSLPPDLGGMAEQLSGSGYFGAEEKTENADFSGAPDLSSFISPDQLTEYLSNYFREVRVRVWWGENLEEVDQVEIVHHVINPTGMVSSSEEQGGGEDGGGASGK